MTAFFNKFLIATILLVTAHAVRAEFNATSYCILVANNAKLGSPESCQTFYTCQNGVAIESECPSGFAFSLKTASCQTQSQVDCYGAEDPCALKKDGFVRDTSSCTGYFYCKNGKNEGRGNCPQGTVLQNGQCEYATCNESDGTTSNVAIDVCSIMPNNMFFGSITDCTQWLKCVNGVLTPGNCPAGFVYNVQKIICDYESGDMCSRVGTGGTDVAPIPSKCTSSEDGNFKADTTDCSVYYQCKNLVWVKNQCPDQDYYDNASNNGNCKSRQSATPIDTCDRCLYSTNTFVNAVSDTCRSYLICQGGKKQGSAGDCPANSYFSEASQACLQGTADLSGYAQNNGACAGAGEVSTTDAPGVSTTDAPTPGGPNAPTTDAPGVSTTDAPTPGGPNAPTTDAPGASTTDATDASTTDAPDSSTTDAPGASTTDAPGASTTDAPGASTTDAPDSSTTDE